MAETSGSRADELAHLLDHLEFAEAFQVTYLANAIVFPAYTEVKRDFGLIRAEYILLACLSHFDTLTAQDVARLSRRPRNTISRAVHRMLAEGYLARAPDPGDGRQARLRITAKGRSLHAEIAAYLKARESVLLGGLETEEREQLRRTLRKLAVHAARLPD